MIPKHCGVDAVLDRKAGFRQERLVCPVCGAWKWVVPRTWQPAKADAATCSECKQRGREVEKSGSEWKRFECMNGHRWSLASPGSAVKRLAPRRFQMGDALLAAMQGMRSR